MGIDTQSLGRGKQWRENRKSKQQRRGPRERGERMREKTKEQSEEKEGGEKW